MSSVDAAHKRRFPGDRSAWVGDVYVDTSDSGYQTSPTGITRHRPEDDEAREAEDVNTVESLLEVRKNEDTRTSQIELDNGMVDASSKSTRSEAELMFLWTWADAGLWSKSLVDQNWSGLLYADELAKDLKMYEQSEPQRPLYIQAPLDPVLGREFKSPKEAIEWLNIFVPVEVPRRGAEEAEKMIWRWKDVGFFWKEAVDRNPVHWSRRLSADELEKELKMYEERHPQRPLYIQNNVLEREFESPKEAIKHLYRSGGHLTAEPVLSRAKSCPSRSKINKPCEASVDEEIMIILLQHGSHGHGSDFENIKKCILAEEQAMQIECWSTPSTEGFNTDSGLETCGEGLAKEFYHFLKEIRAKHPRAQLHLSCISHSYGGLISRYALVVLERSNALREINLHTFVTLAVPHVGAHQLNMFLRLGARGLGAVASNAYQELMLDNYRLDKLCEADSLAPLKRFGRRILYTCTRKDPLVKPESGGLVVLQNTVDASIDLLPASVPGHPNVRKGLRLEPFTDNTLRGSFVEESDWRELKMCTGENSGLKEMVTQQERINAFKGADDIDGVRAHRAAFMLRQLREVGDWSLHFVHFGDHIVRNAHGAIICHPGRIKNGSMGTIAGEDVAKHVAKMLFEPISNE